MRIITWNCNGALRKKFEKLLNFDADIFVIQECENPEQTHHSKYQEWAKNHLWIGDTKNRGVGIFAKANINIKKLDWSNRYEGHLVKHFLPCSINHEFNLLAVWTHRNNSPNFGYIGQLWKYLQVNQDRLTKIIIAGDLNSNTIWDVWDRWWNHSDVIRILKKSEIHSLYHHTMNEEQGKETIPTFFHQKKFEKPFHIDYVFASKELSERLITLEVGRFENWIEVSDHTPIICEFEYSLPE